RLSRCLDNLGTVCRRRQARLPAAASGCRHARARLVHLATAAARIGQAIHLLYVGRMVLLAIIIRSRHRSDELHPSFGVVWLGVRLGRPSKLMRFPKLWLWRAGAGTSWFTK